MLVVCAGRERRREHRWRRRGRSGNRHDVRRWQSGLSTIDVAEGSVLRVPLQLAARQLRQAGRAAAAGRIRGSRSRRTWRRTDNNDRRRVDREAEAAGRHHRLRHEHRRQEVVDSRTAADVAGDQHRSALRRRHAAAAAGGRGQPQMINTKSLLIYGTGRRAVRHRPNAAAALRA